MSYKLDRSFFIPKDAKVIRQEGDAIVYGSEDNGRIHGLAFNGKAQKPSWHYRFTSVENREKHINSWLNSLKVHADYLNERKVKRQAEIASADIRPGDYFYTSWGYDQTNIDYLVVVSVTAKTAVCKMVSPIHVGESGTSDVLMPGEGYGQTFRLKIDGKDRLVGSYPYCAGYTSKRLGYFSRTSIAETKSQTMAMFGH